jgi:hypothetical protein
VAEGEYVNNEMRASDRNLLSVFSELVIQVSALY